MSITLQYVLYIRKNRRKQATSVTHTLFLAIFSVLKKQQYVFELPSQDQPKGAVWVEVQTLLTLDQCLRGDSVAVLSTLPPNTSETTSNNWLSSFGEQLQCVHQSQWVQREVTNEKSNLYQHECLFNVYLNCHCINMVKFFFNWQMRYLIRLIISGKQSKKCQWKIEPNKNLSELP